MIARFRSKPKVVEAVRWTGYNNDEIVEFADGQFRYTNVREPATQGSVYNKSHEDWNVVNQGDWVIKGVAGEFYPCEHSIFIQSYQQIGMS